MKSLYYLEFARSIDINNTPIPAKELNWKTVFEYRVAYENEVFCELRRILLQATHNLSVIRVKKANLIKNILIRLSAKLNKKWMIVTE